MTTVKRIVQGRSCRVVFALRSCLASDRSPCSPLLHDLEYYHSLFPESVQPLNAFIVNGAAVRLLEETLRFLGDEATGILPQGNVLDYAGESCRLGTERSRFVPSFCTSR